MRKMGMLLAMVAAFLAAGAVTLFAAGSAALGTPAPSFSLVDQNGKTVSLADFKGKVVVLEWTNPQCPFVQRHYREKTMTTLASDFAPKGVVWIAINSSSGDTTATNLDWAKQNDVTYPILDDSKGTVGHEYNAKSTPDMFIINTDGNIVYSGAIDNDPDGDKGAARVNYVKQALDEVLAGKTVSVPETKSYGCHVRYAD
ncbi:MAG TPA: redoxin domain-containing protein [Tepidisphaeraceae bacterium]|nr:redoxin domain-containing protein [Tepidisphaeraceae bacterium]